MKEIIELVSCLGWILDFEDQEQRKARFYNADTFMDVWNGKKRITVGKFDPVKKLIHYEFCSKGDLIKLEQIITSL